jgi:hypothetical protein
VAVALEDGTQSPSRRRRQRLYAMTECADHFCFWPILLQKSAATDWPLILSSPAAGLADAPCATPTLRHAQSFSGRWARDQRREAPQVLGDGGQNELVLGASWATQPKATEPQDALQVREPHLDLLALTPRLLKGRGASE